MGQMTMKRSKTIIGLTGNIATGKSVVRRMLVNMGAFGVDADVVAHRMLYPGAPAYEPVVNTFGEAILDENDQISRKALGQIVFQDPDALHTLEELIHPGVEKAIKHLITHAGQKTIVIEAIKLFEADLDRICDVVWVSHTSQNVQMERLLHNRHMSSEEAENRVKSQPPQSEKLKKAGVVINTEGSFKETWEQVQKNLNVTIISTEETHPEDITILHPGQIDLNALSAFMGQDPDGPFESLYEWLGTMAHLAIQQEHELKGFISWLDWNFTATLKNVIIKPTLTDGLSLILKSLERQARNHQCEIGLTSPAMTQKNPSAFVKAGYQIMTAESISHPAWHQAALKCLEDRQNVWVKVLAHPFELEALL